MSRRYVLLFVAVVALGAALTAAGRAPRRDPPPPTAGAEAPGAELALEAREDGMLPAFAAVPKNHRIALTVTSRAARPVRIQLAGYEDRIDFTLSPGDAWHGVVLADRPGDDFAWLLDGRPAGRLAVTGSHLVDGHR